MNSGVLVGCDSSQEWLLGWFFKHLRTYNPETAIAFADFGMTEGAFRWCRQRGEVLKVGPVSSNCSVQWRERGLDSSNWSRSRQMCFRKPLALAASPFERTLWLDLDCQVRASLQPLFSEKLHEAGLAAVSCRSLVYAENLSTQKVFGFDKYNTGVVLVERTSPLLQEWADFQAKGISFQTDEGSLSLLAQKWALKELSHVYNWPVASWGTNADAHIYHWMGKEAKRQLIQSQ